MSKCCPPIFKKLCKEEMFAKYILHTGNNLPCLGITTGENLDSILTKIEAAVCTDEEVITLGPIGASPNANGMTLSSESVLILQPASASFGGAITTGDQVFSGKKTFAKVLISMADAGNYNLQVTGGVLFDVTAEILRFEGVLTDNSASSVYAIDSNGNVVLRTVGSLPAGGGGSSVNQTLFSGNGILTSFQIPHGEAGTPKFIIQPASQDAAGYSYVTADATNITVNYNIAPPFGVNNIIINWIANL